jgi:hypothetical protein
MFIKNVLREELVNSERLKIGYEKEIAKLPKGSLVKKKVKGHEYYYLVYRENGKVFLKYQGKQLDAGFVRRYAEAKKMRAKYRKSLSQAKKQIKYLRSALRGKEPV